MRAIAVALSGSLVLAGCSGSEDGICDSLALSVNAENSMQQPATTFAIGEPITLRVTLTNLADDSITVERQPGQCPVFGYQIHDVGSQLVFEFGSHTGQQFLGECAPSFTLEPGETGFQALTWDQRSDRSEFLPDGTQVPVGQYVVTAFGAMTAYGTMAVHADCGFEADTAFEVQ